MDLVRSVNPAVGDQQVVDIELDRATVLMPIRKNYTSIDSKALWDLDTSKQESVGPGTVGGLDAEPPEGKVYEAPSLQDSLRVIQDTGKS